MPPEQKEKPAPPPPEAALPSSAPARRSMTRTLVNATLAIVLLAAVVATGLFLSRILAKEEDPNARPGRKIDLGAVEVTYWTGAQKDYWTIHVEPTLEMDPKLEGTRLAQAEERLSARKSEIVDKTRDSIRVMNINDIASNDFEKRLKEVLIDLINEKICREPIIRNVWLSRNPVIEKHTP